MTDHLHKAALELAPMAYSPLKSALRHIIEHLRSTAPATAATVRHVCDFKGTNMCDQCGRVLVPKEPQPAEAEVSDEDFAAMAEQLIAEKGWPINPGDGVQFLASAIGNAWHDGFGRSPAARELAERDERIRELEEKLAAFEPVVLAAARWEREHYGQPDRGTFPAEDEIEKSLRELPNKLRPIETRAPAP